MSGSFPPGGPNSLQRTIPSYLYQEYSDDDDLQAFVAAFNAITQQYVDFFNTIGLPIYTGDLIEGALLDWVARGLYGIARPTLPSGHTQDLGALNTWALNTLALNTRETIGPSTYFLTTDDVFKRVITWHFLKGDGRVFNIRWLKRRIMRFLLGANGTNPNVDQTYQVSVTFGVGNQVNIRILAGVRTITGGTFLNSFALNTMPLDVVSSTYQPLPTFAETPTLIAAVQAAVLELPFQFTYVISTFGYMPPAEDGTWDVSAFDGGTLWS